MQIANHGGDYRAAAEMIRSLIDQLPISGSAAVQWAGICSLGEDTQTSRRLLEAGVAGATDKPALEAALQLATEMRLNETLVSVRAKLAALFPDSLALQFDCDFRLIQLCSRSVPSNNADASRIDFPEPHAYLADKLQPGEAVAYADLLAEVKQRWPSAYELALMCAASHAESADRLADAMGIAFELIPDTRFSPAAARLQL